MAAFSLKKETSKDLAATRCSLSIKPQITWPERQAYCFFGNKSQRPASRDRLASKSARWTSGSAEFHALASVGHQRPSSTAAVNRLMTTKTRGGGGCVGGNREQTAGSACDLTEDAGGGGLDKASSGSHMTSSLKTATCMEKRESAEMETLEITSRQGRARAAKGRKRRARLLAGTRSEVKEAQCGTYPH